MTDHDLVLVVDYGAQYAQLIARRVREAHVYSEIVPHTMPVAEILARRPKAIILSGGPQSVYAEGAPQVDPALFEAGVPAFGICYGFMAMAQALGGDVRLTGRSEFGRTVVDVHADSEAVLLAGVPARFHAWMSHGDEVVKEPPGFTLTASSAGAHVAAFEDVGRGLAGVQWHPEVLHSEHGQQVLEHFLLEIAGCRPTWTMAQHHRGAGRTGSAPRWVTAGRCVRCPAASTPRSPPRSSSAPSATGSPASTSTTG